MANDARCMTTKHVKRSALLRTIRTVDVVLAARKNQVTNGRQRACFYCGGGDEGMMLCVGSVGGWWMMRRRKKERTEGRKSPRLQT